MGDPGPGLGVAELPELFFVDLGEAVEHASAHAAVDTIGIFEVEDRIGARAHLDTLVFRGQEAASPEAGIERLLLARSPGDHDNIGRKILVRAAEAVAEPGAEARLAGLLDARIDEGDGRIVVDRFGVEALDDGDVVYDLGNLRENL